MEEKTCCVTGHREIPANQVNYVNEKLREEIVQAVADGYTTFVPGFADGVDLIFAELVVEQKQTHPELFLEAAIPYRTRLRAKELKFQRLLSACDGVYVQAETYEGNGCFLNRNRYMVSKSQRVIAVYDGRENGGTAFTMRYANVQQKEVRIITI